MTTLRKLGIGIGIGIGTALAFGACLGDAEIVDPAARDALFDLAAFVDYQDSVLAGVPMRKRVRVGEAVDETKVIEDVDWATELAPFAGANVNKPALVDEYIRERVGDPADGNSRIILTATDSSARVRRIEIVCDVDVGGHGCPYGEVAEIFVETRFESVIADTDQRLRWTREGYEVRSRQDVVGRDERVLLLEGARVPGAPNRQ